VFVVVPIGCVQRHHHPLAYPTIGHSVPRFPRVLLYARIVIGGLVVGALLASTLVAVPAEPAAAVTVVAPASIALTANRTTLLAGQSVTLTAVTDIAVQGSASTIAILDQTTGATLTTCTTGRYCVATATFATGGPHTYIATVRALSSTTVVVERAPWTVTLAADDSTVVAGATTRLVATANQNLTNTSTNYQTYVFDTTAGTLLGSCTIGKVCAVRTAVFTGGGQHDYVAVVAAAGAPATLGDALDIQAQSDAVTVGAGDWSITLVAAGSNLVAGATTVLTATANQNVGNTDSRYQTYIFDTTAGTLLGTCVTGKVCSIRTVPFSGNADGVPVINATRATTLRGAPVSGEVLAIHTAAFTESGRHNYVAVVAASGAPATLADALDIRAQSEPVTVTAAAWSLSLETDRSEFAVGTSAKITARANQDVGKTDGVYVIDIFDRTTGQLVKTCATGTVCSVAQTFATGPEHYYVAAVAAAGSPANRESAQNVLAKSGQVSIARAPWHLAATISVTNLPANGIARLTVLSDQSLTRTNGAYAIYWFNSSSGERVGGCTAGKRCRATVLDTGSTAAHVYVAYVAAATDPTSVSELVDVLGTSNIVAPADAWALTLTSQFADSAPGSQNSLTATPNFDMSGLPAGPTDVGILFFDTTSDTLVGQCQNADAASGCTIPIGFAEVGDHRYRAVIAELTDPATLGDAVNIQAVSNDVTVTGRQWAISLDISPSLFGAYDPVTVSATISPALPTDGSHFIYLLDQTTGQHESFCDPAVGSCSETRGPGYSQSSWFDGSGEHSYVAMLASDVGSGEPLTDVLAVSNQATLAAMPWGISLSVSTNVFATDQPVTFTVTANQSFHPGMVSIVDKTDGTTLAGCEMDVPSGTTCTAVSTNPFLFGGPQDYVAVLRVDPSSGDVLAESNTVSLARMPWTVTLATTSEVGWEGLNVYFNKAVNQNFHPGDGNFGDPGVGYQVAVYNFTTGRLVCHGFFAICSNYDVLYGPGQPTPCYVAVVARTTPYGLSDAEDIQTMSGCAAVARPDGLPASETVGGGNPSEKHSQCQCADPVNTATGEFSLPESDIGIEGVGPSLDVSRTYSSTLASSDGPFGYGWSADFAMKLDVLSAGDTTDPRPRQVQITQENGATVVFTEGPNHLYSADARVLATLTRDDSTGNFTFTRRSGAVMEFNSAGRLVELRDLRGNAVAVGYNDSNQVTSLSASGGRTLTLTWADGRVSQVADSAGRSVSYGYSNAGNLTSATGVDGAVTGYGYDSAHYMTTVSKPGGAVTTNVYDGSNRVTSQTDPTGRVTIMDYAATGTTITAPGGSETVDSYTNGRIVSQTVAATTDVAATTSYAYDAAGNVTSVTDPLGKVSTFTYDGDGNMLSKTDPLGRTSHWTYGALDKPLTSTDALGRRSTFTYNAFGDILSSTSPAGHVNTVTYNADGTVATSVDAAGHATSFTYDSAGRLLSTTDPDGLVSRIAYDAAGVLTSTTDADGKSTTVTTDAAGRALTVTDPNGHITSLTYDVRGNRTSVTDANGSVTATTYDKADRPKSSTDAAGKVTLYTYTAAGQLATVKDANSHTTTYAYDDAGQLASVTDPLDRITTYAYDKAGRTVSTVLPSGAESSAVYDGAGQLSSTTNAVDETTQYAYNAAGQLVSTTDPLGRVVTSAYTDDGQPSTVTMPDASTQVSTYTQAGLLASSTNADGKVTSYSYSDAGRLLGKVEPGGLATSVAYDSAGRTHTVTLPDGSTQTYSYDDTGKVTRVHYSAAGSTDTTYAYDDGGRPTSMTDATGTTSFVYDTAGRLHSETDGAGATVSYAYDSVGKLTAITYPGGHTATYAYDAAGQMTSLTDWASHTTTFGWDPNGQLATQADPNGVVQSNTYDAAGRTTLISDSTTTAGVVASFGYGYDAAGQLANDTSTNGGVTTAHDYGYDPLGQLGSVATTPVGQPTTTGSFGATPAGQLTATAGGDALTYNAAQQLTDLVPAVGAAVSYGYNARGSRTSSTVAASGSGADAVPAATTTYGYSPAGALASVTTPSATVHYTVDGRGLRQSRTAGGSTDQFVWSTVGGLPLLLDDGDHRYLYGPTLTPVAQVADDGTVQYLHGDLLGSVRSITDSSGAVVASSTFDTFGVRTAHTGAADSLFGFTGNWTDPDTGLVLLRARDYDPATGQFLSVDPAVDTTSQPYAYAGNDPVLLTDPSGLDFWSDALHAVGVGLEAAVRASGCALEQAAAFGAGGLDAFTGGLSSVVLGAAIPGYNDFVAGHQAAFTAGSIAVTVIQIAAAIISTAGAAAGVVIAVVALKVAAKAAIKDVAKAAESAAVRTVERDVVQTAEHGAAQSGKTLFHYTDEAGMKGIRESGKLSPSLKSVNPTDARYGNGQYLFDIAPGTKSCAELSRCFIGQPFQGQRFTSYVEINVDDLSVIQGRPNVFVVPGESSLDLAGRIVGFGAN
jgi:RHS repeat-associated protein